MRILLDENLPRRLGQYFSEDHLVRTVQAQGWAGKRNGELLTLSENDFDVFVTMDRGLEYQQHLAGYKLAVILIRASSNRLADLLPILPQLLTAVASVAPGQLKQIP